MKRALFISMVSLFFVASCMGYSLSGTVYYSGTTIFVPNAQVTLTATPPGGAASTRTVYADSLGTFSISWASANMVGYSMKISANNPSLTAYGNLNWSAYANIEYKNVYIKNAFTVAPAVDVTSMPAHWVGPSLDPARVTIQANAPLPAPVANGVVNFMFNAPVVNVINVVPVAPDVVIDSWNMPIPGKLVVNAHFDPPKNLPEFPAESFFDVFYDLDIPDNDAEESIITMDEASFELVNGDHILATPSQTQVLLGTPDTCKAGFLVSSMDQWQVLLDAAWPKVNIIPMAPAEWNDPEWGYAAQWAAFIEEGEPYPPSTVFLPPELTVFPGDNNPAADEPDDAGLVMRWADEQDPDGEYATAWKYDYGLDPDVSNSMITVTATPPAGITNISLGMQDANGNIRSWHWSCGAGGALPSNVPTTITIDTTMTGLNAATPAATGYANNPAFNLATVQFIIADENGNWIASQGVPAPGTTTAALWNYWHNLSVRPKTTAYKGNYVKFSQPPEVIDPTVPLIDGWDVKSVFPYTYDNGQSFTWAADDWKCYDNRPITDVHWWGSFIGWTQPGLPPQVPDYFVMAIWKDVPAGDTSSSHPKQLLWRHKCDKWVWNFAGYDQDPRSKYYGDYNQQLFGEAQQDEACFQFNQLLSQDDWFYQEPMEDGLPNVYWFSIAAVYDGVEISQIQYPWGWKSKPYDSTKAPDPAVVITSLDAATPPWDIASNPGSGGHITEVTGWYPLILSDPSLYPDGEWFDLAFELTTNKPKCPGLTADLNKDCIVNLNDFAILADQWLESTP